MKAREYFLKEYVEERKHNPELIPVVIIINHKKYENNVHQDQ